MSTSAMISGDNVYGTLKWETGTHRVQRVPATETGGRTHTSAMMVIVMMEAREMDVQINDCDLKIDVFRSSGPGGQSVNVTDSAVRITHLPTGISVSMQDERSQSRNKEKAMKVLRSRILDRANNEAQNSKKELRNSQLGSGDRSERIRTYNFIQNRITDHRTNVTRYDVGKMLRGELLDDFIEALRKQASLQAVESLSTNPSLALAQFLGKGFENKPMIKE